MLGAEISRNGKSYDSGDVDINIDGQMYPGVAKISYELVEESTLNKSLKRKPTSYGIGAESYTGSMELYMEDVVSLQKKAGGSLTKLKPFWTTVTFTNEDQEVITDTIFWKFKKDGRSADGGTGLKTEYEMLVLELNLNV